MRENEKVIIGHINHARYMIFSIGNRLINYKALYTIADKKMIDLRNELIKLVYNGVDNLMKSEVEVINVDSLIALSQRAATLLDANSEAINDLGFTACSGLSCIFSDGLTRFQDTLKVLKSNIPVPDEIMQELYIYMD
jgi:hypothetical protein